MKPSPLIGDSTDSDNQTPWPDPQPIDIKLPPVEALTPDLLPESIRLWIIDIAERMQVPLDFPAAAMVVALAGAISRRASIQPKALDSGWVEIPNLWGGIIGDPGVLKSPTIGVVMEHLEAVEKVWREEFAKEMANWEKQKAKEKRNGND